MREAKLKICTFEIKQNLFKSIINLKIWKVDKIREEGSQKD